MLRMILRFIFIFIVFLTSCTGGPSLAVPQSTNTTTSLPPTATVPPTVTVPSETPTIPVSTATEIQAAVTPTPMLLPPIGRGSSFAYDRGNGEVLVFGGSLEGASDLSNETWAWNGHAWNQHQPQNAPPARLSPGIVYDPNLKGVVLFGGAQMEGQAFGDMWLWDGENWTEIKPPQLPAPRVKPLMVYDDARNEVVMFGGHYFDKDGNFIYLNESWTFDGQTWAKRNPTHSPLGGDGVPQPIMTYDVARKQIVLLEFGGGTWVWKGNDWNKLAVAGESPLSVEGALGYDEKNQLVVLWGHDTLKVREFPSETWLFDGQTWSIAKEREHGPFSPEATLLYDVRQQKLLLFAFVGGDYLLIWEWGDTGWQEIGKP